MPLFYDTWPLSAMANGQIKGAGNADKGASIRYMKKFDAVLILLLILLNIRWLW